MIQRKSVLICRYGCYTGRLVDNDFHPDVFAGCNARVFASVDLRARSKKPQPRGSHVQSNTCQNVNESSSPKRIRTNENLEQLQSEEVFFKRDHVLGSQAQCLAIAFVKLYDIFH